MLIKKNVFVVICFHFSIFEPLETTSLRLNFDISKL